MISRDSERLYSSMRFEGDGVTKLVSLTFDLNREDGLAIDFGEGLVTEGFTIDRDTNPVVVIFEEPLPLGKTITIRRLTDISEVKHIFQWLGNAQGGSDFTAKNIDENFEQITRASQDAMDAQTLATETLEEMSGIRDDAIDARDKAKVSETNAKQSEVNSKDSELKAKVSETNAKASEINSKASEDLVIENAEEARISELNSKESEVNSKASEVASKESEINASSSESNAMQYAQTSISSANEAVTSAFNAKVSEIQASSSEVNAKESEELAEKWASNPEDVVVVDDKYSAYHWAMKAENAVGGITQEVQEALDLKVDKTQVKSVFGTSTTDVASQKLVTDVNNLVSSANSELEKKANKTDVTSSLALKGDITYIDEEIAKKQNIIAGTPATQEWTNEQGFLKQANLNGYATQTWVNQQGFIKSAPAIDYSRTCALGAEQLTPTENVWIEGGIAAAYSEVPSNSVITGIQFNSNKTRHRVKYRIIIRAGN